MSQLPVSGPQIRVPASFFQQQFNLPPPSGIEQIGRGITQAGEAFERIRLTRNRRRSAEFDVKNVNLLSKSFQDAIEMSLTSEPDEVDDFYNQQIESRLDELREIKDRDLREEAITRFSMSAARTGATLRSSLVRREGERMETAHEAFFAQTLRAVERGVVNVDEAMDGIDQRLEDGVGAYLTPEQAKLRSTQARNDLEVASAAGIRASLVESSTELTDGVARAENDEQRAEFRTEFQAELAEAVKDGAINQDEAARRLVAFDATAKAKTLEEISSMRQRLQDAPHLPNGLRIIDQISERARELPDMPQRDTLMSEISRAMLDGRRSDTGAQELFKIYETGVAMPVDAPKDKGSRNKSYDQLRSSGVGLVELTDFFSQDRTLPTNLVRDVRALFDPEGGTFSIEEGINVLSSAYKRDRDSARRLVAEDSVMKVALAAGVHGDAQMRQDATRLLSAGTAKRNLADIDRLIAPKNAEDRKKRIDVTEILADNDDKRGTPRLDDTQRDLFAGLLRLEYLRSVLELGETGDVQTTAENSGQRAADSFLRLRTSVFVNSVDNTIYYDHELIGANTRQFEANLQQFPNFGESLGRVLFSVPPAPQTGMMVRISDQEVILPASDQRGMAKIMVFDTTQADFARSMQVFNRGDEGFARLSNFIVEANRGASFDPLGHLRRQPGESQFPDDPIAIEYLKTARRQFAGMNLPPDQLRTQTKILADRLARQRGWSALVEPEPE